MVKTHQCAFQSQGFQLSLLNAHCSLTMWPWWMVVGFQAALRWVCTPNGWIRRGSWGQAEAWHDTTPLWGWFEVSVGKKEGAMQPLICPSPASRLGGWDYEMLGSWCIPMDPQRQWEGAGTADSELRGLGCGLLRGKLRCGSRWISLDDYWKGHLAAPCGKSMADKRCLTRRGNILTCLRFPPQFSQTSIISWLLQLPIQDPKKFWRINLVCRS